MTKSELIEALKDFPDDMEVKVWLTYENFSQQVVRIKNVYSDNRLRWVNIEPDIY